MLHSQITRYRNFRLQQGACRIGPQFEMHPNYPTLAKLVVIGDNGFLEITLVRRPALYSGNSQLAFIVGR